MKNWFKYFLCPFDIHFYEIYKWSTYKENHIYRRQVLIEEGFSRVCMCCGKKQTLKRPEKYHPYKYVWTNEK